VFHDVHRIAKVYHWSAHEIFGMALPHRHRFLALIAGDEDVELFAALDMEP